MKVIHFIPSIDRTSGGVGAYMQLLSKELGKLCELYSSSKYRASAKDRKC